MLDSQIDNWAKNLLYESEQPQIADKFSKKHSAHNVDENQSIIEDYWIKE